MNQEKIQQVEDEVKALFLSNPDEDWQVFWFLHLKFVIEKAKELTEKYGGNLEIVWLAAILHDVTQLENPEDHHLTGGQKAYEMLLEKGFEIEIAEKVKNVILTHRVNQYKPENLEQKILATADAMSHFSTAHYLWMSHIIKKPFGKLIEKFSEKTERDYGEKIFFEDERKQVEKQYEVLKGWFEFKL
ncbi:MAG: HD domain-containing protein [Candidatus Moraniibacteriota bacterium]